MTRAQLYNTPTVYTFRPEPLLYYMFHPSWPGSTPSMSVGIAYLFFLSIFPIILTHRSRKKIYQSQCSGGWQQNFPCPPHSLRHPNCFDVSTLVSRWRHANSARLHCSLFLSWILPVPSSTFDCPPHCSELRETIASSPLSSCSANVLYDLPWFQRQNHSLTWRSFPCPALDFSPSRTTVGHQEFYSVRRIRRFFLLVDPWKSLLSFKIGIDPR
jgi:hypothetical protein